MFHFWVIYDDSVVSFTGKYSERARERDIYCITVHYGRKRRGSCVVDYVSIGWNLSRKFISQCCYLHHELIKTSLAFKLFNSTPVLVYNNWTVVCVVLRNLVTDFINTSQIIFHIWHEIALLRLEMSQGLSSLRKLVGKLKSQKSNKAFIAFSVSVLL